MSDSGGRNRGRGRANRGGGGGGGGGHASNGNQPTSNRKGHGGEASGPTLASAQAGAGTSQLRQQLLTVCDTSAPVDSRLKTATELASAMHGTHRAAAVRANVQLMFEMLDRVIMDP